MLSYNIMTKISAVCAICALLPSDVSNSIIQPELLPTRLLANPNTGMIHWEKSVAKANATSSRQKAATLKLLEAILDSCPIMFGLIELTQYSIRWRNWSWTSAMTFIADSCPIVIQDLLLISTTEKTISLCPVSFPRRFWLAWVGLLAAPKCVCCKVQGLKTKASDNLRLL